MPVPSPASFTNALTFGHLLVWRSPRGCGDVRERDRLRRSSGEIGRENRNGTRKLRAVRARVHGKRLSLGGVRLHSRASSDAIGVVQTDGEEQKKTLHTSYRQTWWHTDEGAFLERALEGNSGVRRRSRRVRAEVQNDDRVEIQNESGDGAEDDPTQSPSGPDSRFPRVFNTTAYGHER